MLLPPYVPSVVEPPVAKTNNVLAMIGAIVEFVFACIPGHPDRRLDPAADHVRAQHRVAVPAEEGQWMASSV